MSKKIRNIEELRDSRLMFEKTVPPFGYFLIIIVTVFLVGIIIWSIYAVKPYMITASGTVTSTESNYVMPSYTGEILECHMEEGMLVEEGDLLFTVKSTDYDLQEEQLVSNREAYVKQKEQYEKLVQSIKDNKNYFDGAAPEDSLYYSTYEVYQSQIKQSTVDTGMYKAYGYSDEQIEAELLKNEGKVAELYYGAIQSAENSISECELQIASIDSQISAVGSGQSSYGIRATSSGVLHLLADYKPGMVVQTASAVATITPENAGTIVEAYVSTADMARMKEGDRVDLAVDGLSQSVYGTIEGTVMQIDSNLTSMEGENGTSQVFKIKVEPESTYVISRSGDKVNLANGMTVQARIEYDKVTYFHYVLEKIGLWTS